MTVAVRPPDYFPRLAVAALLLAADRIILADTLPYSRQGHHNRCRVRTAGPGGVRWLTIPVGQGAVGRPLCAVAPAEDGRWRHVHRKTLLHHLGSAPFYAHYQPGVEAALAAPAPSLAALTVPTVRWTAEALDAPAEVILASELPGAPAEVPAILRAAGATAFLSLSDASAADRAHAAAAGLPLRVLRFEERPRRQNFPGFAPGCAALDLLANYGPEAYGVLRDGIVELGEPDAGEGA